MPQAQPRSAPQAAPSAVPRIVWRTGPFPRGELPPQAARALDSFVTLNPGWTQVYTTDEENREFLGRVDPRALAAYDALVPGAFKADVWRLFVLRECGGVYADLGMTLLQPLSTFLDPVRDDCMLVVDLINPWWGHGLCALYNAFMAVRPHHPLLDAMCEAVVTNVLQRRYGANMLDITGPVALGRVFTAFGGLPPTQPLMPGRVQLHNPTHGVVRVVLGAFDPQDKAVLVGPNPSQGPILARKFEGYTAVVYGSRMPHYATLWRARKVYVEDLDKDTLDT